MRITKTHLAARDLEEIWLYIAHENIDAADALIDQMMATCLLIAAKPTIGRARPELLPELRSFPVNHYVLFYMPMSDGIEIIRVIHSARDIANVYLPQ